METMTVTLPNGKVIEGVPKGTSKDVVMDKAIKAGLASADDFKTQPKSSPEEFSFLEENMDLPLGITGALSGAAMGSPLGPVGAVLGGIIGGAAGTFGGSLLSDELTGKELDFSRAVEQAMISAGFDVATLGLGKVLKPAYVAAKMKLGFSPTEVAEELMSSTSKITEAGTQESLVQSQKFLAERGATLSPYQTGNASRLQTISQKIAETGLLSGKIMEDNIAKVDEAVQDGFRSLMSSQVSGDLSSLGSDMYGVVRAGKNALMTSYGTGLSEVQQLAGRRAVPIEGLKKTLQGFVEDNARSGFSVLDDDALKFVEKTVGSLDNIKAIPPSELIDLEKKLLDQIRQFGDVDSGVYNDTAARQLSDLSSRVRDSMSNLLKIANPEAAEKYAKINQAYAKGMNGLLPEINSTFIKRANKENYTALGGMLTQSGNKDQVSKFLRSIDVAYGQLGKEGAKDLPYKSAKEAKQAIRETYLKNLMSDVTSDTFSIKGYSKLAGRLNTPKEAAKLKVLFGESYPQFRQLLNVMEEASAKSNTNIATLLLRSAEYSSLGFATYQGVSQDPTVGLTAAAVLFSPIVLAKMATNPKAINKLIMLSKKEFKTEDALQKAASLVLNDFVDKLSEEEQAEVRNSFRQ